MSHLGNSASRLDDLFEQAISIADLADRKRWVDRLDISKEELAKLHALLDADADSDETSKHLTRMFVEAVETALEIPHEGQCIGKYKLLREIGSGGSSIVFVAERIDQQFEQRVAIKFIKGFAGAVSARQLRRERQILASFDHPAIARLLDGGETPSGQPYLVMEYVQGEIITRACSRQRISLQERLRILASVARAVHYAHQRLVVHLDIKPENVLLREDGRIALLDFGISTLLDPIIGISTQTQPWFTPGYASPEQRRGEPVSTATDVYAIGLLMFELLTDKAPSADNEGRINLPSSALGGTRGAATLKGDLDAIVMLATAPDPERRYQSAEAFAEDIERYLANLPTRATSHSYFYRAFKHVARHPFGSIATLAFAMVIGLFAWQLAAESERSRQEAKAALAVSEFLLGLFELADPARGAGRKALTPSQLVDLGTEKLRQSTDLSPRERVRLMGTVGELYNKLGEPLRASVILRDAMVLSHGQIHSAERIRLLEQLGMSFEGRGLLGLAEEAYREGIEIAEENRLAGEMARLLPMLGLTIQRQGKLEMAEALLQRAVTERKKAFPDQPAEAAEAQVLLADLLRESGQLGRAVPLMNQAIDTMRRHHKEDSPKLLSALGFLAELQRTSGDLDSAERTLRTMLDAHHAAFGPESAMTMSVHNSLGRVYLSQGRASESIEHFEKAYSIAESTLANDDPNIAILANNLSWLKQLQGDHAAAESMLLHAIQILEPHSANQGPSLARLKLNFGRMLTNVGRYQDAREYLDFHIPDDGPAFNRVICLQLANKAEWFRRLGMPEESLELLDDLAERPKLPNSECTEWEVPLQTRGLIYFAAGDYEKARTALETAYDIVARRERARSLTAGGIALDLTELELAASRKSRAAHWLDLADGAFAGMPPESPQAKRLSEIRRTSRQVPPKSCAHCDTAATGR